jgi:hypothetical protein
VKRFAPLVLLAFVACSSPGYSVYATSFGNLKPGSVMTVNIQNGILNAYKPAEGDAADRFTISASAATSASAQPPPPVIRPDAHGIIVNAGSLASLLVRVPQGVDLVVHSQNGNVNVTDISGNADVHAGVGDVKIMISGRAQASVEKGSINATMGANTWPGTLHFSSGDGDVTVFVLETAAFHARLHTDDGTLFTDFDLRGTSNGSNETIDAPVNGGNPYGVDLESKRGAVRLLKLSPQA